MAQSGRSPFVKVTEAEILEVDIHSDTISSIIAIRDSVDGWVLCRFRSGDIEQSRSEWILPKY